MKLRASRGSGSWGRCAGFAGIADVADICRVAVTTLSFALIALPPALPPVLNCVTACLEIFFVFVDPLRAAWRAAGSHC